jgi:signal transduction histidine kinase
LPGNNIQHIEDDGRGFFWISANTGILRVSKAELSACADGLSRELHYRLFSANDGVPTMARSSGLQPAGCKTPDGRLLFPSSGGLVMIDPGCIQTNLLPPPVYIEKVLVDDHTVERDPANSPLLRIPPGQHQVEIRYTALSYSAPDRVFFKYRLDGMDKNWVSAGMRRMAHYSYLPPGKYNFHVIACNDDAVWNEAGAQVSFVVRPYFWQTLWFRILAWAMALSAAGGIVWLDARRRLQRKLARIEQQRAVEQERARIAHDIHDDLGTYLTRITMLCDPARSGSGNVQQATTSLQCIHETATELTEAMAETVWAVNPHHDTLDSLINYLQKFAQEFLEHAGIRCRLEVPFALPDWPLSAETRHNLFLAFKETLNNVVKHAGASEVHVSLTLEPAGFLLVVSDNGRGFTNETAPDGVVKNPAEFNGGNGLRSIRHRMSGIGGGCEIRSAPAQGTQVHFRVPVQTPPTGNGDPP